MRQFIMAICMSLILLSVMAGAQQQPILVTGDMRDDEILVDITLRDADITEVLTALFNTTNGKYAVEIAPDVVGRIPLLSVQQMPFDDVLAQVLSSQYSFNKRELSDGTVRYLISRGNETAAATLNPVNPPPPVSVPLIIPSNTTTIETPDGLMEIANNDFAKPAVMVSKPAASESSVLKFIDIQYISLSGIVSALGGMSIDVYGSGTVSGRSAGSSNLNLPSNINNNTNSTTGMYTQPTTQQ